VGGWVDSIHLGDMQLAWFGVLCGCGRRAKGQGNETPRRPCSLTRGRRVGPGESNFGPHPGKSRAWPSASCPSTCVRNQGNEGHRVGMNNLVIIAVYERHHQKWMGKTAHRKLTADSTTWSERAPLFKGWLGLGSPKDLPPEKKTRPLFWWLVCAFRPCVFAFCGGWWGMIWWVYSVEVGRGPEAGRLLTVSLPIPPVSISRGSARVRTTRGDRDKRQGQLGKTSQNNSKD